MTASPHSATDGGDGATPRPSPVLAAVVDRLTADDLLMTRREVAAYLRVSVPTLERWAAQGIGPRWRRVGGRALCPLSEVRRIAGGEAA
jgi:excisionase family DNA binding protein